MQDYYKILGVPPTASPAEIKRAYRRLMKGCHPDVNASPKAAEWSRQLNEAYRVLHDSKARMSHDLDLKDGGGDAGRARESERASNDSRRHADRGRSRQSEPGFCCECCGRFDASLRIAATWRVHSFITYTKKSPTMNILCGRCRVKRSLAANAYTGALGWWSIYGLFWSVEAIFHNARGGQQSSENNANLLNAVAYQLYQAGQPGEAYVALLAARKLRRGEKTEKAIEALKGYANRVKRKSFWDRFRGLELHPFCYHASVGACVIVLSVVGIRGLNAGSTTRPYDPVHEWHTFSPPTREAQRFYENESWTAVKAGPGVFSEPEQVRPQQGALAFSHDVGNYTGATAPLKVRPGASGGDYVMKVVDWNTGEFVAVYFIRRGETLSTELPPGSYKLKFASGVKWYGPKYLFGPATTYSQISDKILFVVSGDYAKGRQIDLSPQEDGKLCKRRMRPEDW
jgi:hypothetical protein